MPRLRLTDEHWSKLCLVLLQNGIYHKRNLRLTVEGMLYRIRIGCPWRDLPDAFGPWSKAYKRFNAGGQDQAIGTSRAGKTSKIHLAVDAFGLPAAFEITGGQVNDSTQATVIIEKFPHGNIFVGDKGDDSEAIRQRIEAQGVKAVIPRKRNSVKGNADLDKGLYRYRHLVENAFAKLKQYRAVATRFDKLKRNYQGVIAMACAIIWLPM